VYLGCINSAQCRRQGPIAPAVGPNGDLVANDASSWPSRSFSAPPSDEAEDQPSERAPSWGQSAPGRPAVGRPFIRLVDADALPHRVAKFALRCRMICGAASGGLEPSVGPLAVITILFPFSGSRNP
jgi:hypothetical protein